MGRAQQSELPVAIPPSRRLTWGCQFANAAVILAWGWMVNRRADRTVISLGTFGVLATLFVRLPIWLVLSPNPATTSVSLDSGLVIQVPDASDQCWGVFPLCTPSPASDLALRGVDWRDGFGRWGDPGERG